ncbi:MAG TPA: lytic transglycosylase domain-containing protein [Burkholderiales bacterium]|nr:lytic transglycosylase domain-containing protein [Burkholderiales bacterium]
MSAFLQRGLYGIAAALLLVAGTRAAHAPVDAPFASCVPDAAEAPQGAASDPAQRTLAGYLARRFTIAPEAAQRIVGAAFDAGDASSLDPLLLLAMIAVESRFNPFAQSDNGAKGLMQIIPRYHLDKLAPLGGESAVLDPEANIRVGAQILQEYVARAGSLEAGLQVYNGAADDASAQYAQKILAVRSRLEQAAYPGLRRAEIALNNAKGS